MNAKKKKGKKEERKNSRSGIQDEMQNLSQNSMTSLKGIKFELKFELIKI